MEEQKLKLSSTENLLKKQKEKKLKAFIKGPIQLSWLTEVCKLSKSAMRVAWAICFLRGVHGDIWFKLETGVTRKFSLDRQAKSRGLQELEHAGLIKVKRRRGALPQIKIIEV